VVLYKLPITATKIQLASASSHWLARIEYVRFDIPIEGCAHRLLKMTPSGILQGRRRPCFDHLSGHKSSADTFALVYRAIRDRVSEGLQMHGRWDVMS
jgi:hypothetical protein